MSDKKQAVEHPVCPYCKHKMEPVHYVGYYDQFHHWQCDCDKLPNAQEQRGQYV